MPDPNASDWSELDLLTVAEATERLDAEEADLRRALDTATADAETALRQRLELVARARERALAARVSITPGRVRSLAEIASTPGPPD